MSIDSLAREAQAGNPGAFEELVNLASHADSLAAQLSSAQAREAMLREALTMAVSVIAQACDYPPAGWLANREGVMREAPRLLSDTDSTWLADHDAEVLRGYLEAERAYDSATSTASGSAFWDAHDALVLALAALDATPEAKS